MHDNWDQVITNQDIKVDIEQSSLQLPKSLASFWDLNQEDGKIYFSTENFKIVTDDEEESQGSEDSRDKSQVYELNEDFQFSSFGWTKIK